MSQRIIWIYFIFFHRVLHSYSPFLRQWGNGRSDYQSSLSLARSHFAPLIRLSLNKQLTHLPVPPLHCNWWLELSIANAPTAYDNFLPNIILLKLSSDRFHASFAKYWSNLILGGRWDFRWEVVRWRNNWCIKKLISFSALELHFALLELPPPPSVYVIRISWLFEWIKCSSYVRGNGNVQFSFNFEMWSGTKRIIQSIWTLDRMGSFGREV